MILFVWMGCSHKIGRSDVSQETPMIQVEVRGFHEDTPGGRHERLGLIIEYFAPESGKMPLNELKWEILPLNLNESESEINFV
jgi:hypothetical protein